MKDTKEHLNKLKALVNEGRLTQSEFNILETEMLNKEIESTVAQAKKDYSANSKEPMMRAATLPKEEKREPVKFNQNKKFVYKEKPYVPKAPSNPFWSIYKWMYIGFGIFIVVSFLKYH